MLRRCVGKGVKVEARVLGFAPRGRPFERATRKRDWVLRRNGLAWKPDGRVGDLEWCGESSSSYVH